MIPVVATCWKSVVGLPVKVILSSGYAEQETIDLFQGKGLAGFIQKPYQPLKLLEKMREVLEPVRGAHPTGTSGASFSGT